MRLPAPRATPRRREQGAPWLPRWRHACRCRSREPPAHRRRRGRLPRTWSVQRWLDGATRRPRPASAMPSPLRRGPGGLPLGALAHPSLGRPGGRPAQLLSAAARLAVYDAETRACHRRAARGCGSTRSPQLAPMLGGRMHRRPRHGTMPGRPRRDGRQYAAWRPNGRSACRRTLSRLADCAVRSVSPRSGPGRGRLLWRWRSVCRRGPGFGRGGVAPALTGARSIEF